jgi:predicted short-subunit dehydrogenase-like oxidoreductase (DUF2520 family)
VVNISLKIGIIGIGTVGSTLAQALTQSGYCVTALASRSFDSSSKLASSIDGCRAYHTPQQVCDVANFIFITTGDDTIKEVADSLKWHQGQFAVHCSGADTSRLLTKTAINGAQSGVFHPLQTLALKEQALLNLKDTTFAIEAEGELLGILKEMATSLGGKSIELKAEDKVLYHASAVIASNYLVTLLALSVKLWQSFGKSEEEAITALLPLVKGTINNIENIGIPNCLTGPISRGDNGTIEKHLKALKIAPDILAIYRQLGKETLPLAQARGSVDGETAQKLEGLFKDD